MKKILIVEDEEPMAEALAYTLRKEGYEVGVARDGTEGLELWGSDGADLVLLDLMLPGMDGLEVCRRIRTGSSVPILILTAKDSDIDEVLGLEMGADDYVTKPFNSRKLVARVRALIRRAEGPAGTDPERIGWGDIVVDLARHEVTKGGRQVHLTPLEYRILVFLATRPGKAVPREAILAGVWPEGFYGSEKTLDVHVRHLRSKIEDDPSDPRYIRTVRGTGYRLDVPNGGGG